MHQPLRSMFSAACVLLLTLGFQTAFAQGRGSVMGQVTDPVSKAPLSDITVVFECQGNQLPFFTNDSGFYYASNIPVGTYSATAAYMNNHSTVTGITVGSGDQKEVDIALNKAVEMDSVVKTEYRIKLIDPFVVEEFKLDRGTFKDEPITKLDDITATAPGVVDINGVFYVHGAREGALAYVIDGSPVMAKADIPLCGLQTYTIYDGFIPPKYGDTVGGVVVLETRNFFSRSH